MKELTIKEAENGYIIDASNVKTGDIARYVFENDDENLGGIRMVEAIMILLGIDAVKHEAAGDAAQSLP